MKRSAFLALAAGALWSLAPFHAGHGGQYRGPGDTVPPGGSAGSGGGRPGAGPAGPGTGGGNNPGNPFSPRSGPGGGAPGQPTTGGVDTASPDLTTWTFWWEFNKDPYLDLKRRLHEGSPTTGDAGFFLGNGARDQGTGVLAPDPRTIRDVVVPALLRALEGEPSRDMETAVMIALAKIGETREEGGESHVRALLRARLASPDQEVSETAALALGIRGHVDAVDDLLELLADSAAGRELVGRTNQVPFRTRAFAAYALGLVGGRTEDPEEAARIVRQLATALDGDTTSSRDLGVACVLALGLVPLPATGEAPAPDAEAVDPAAGRAAQVEYLLRFYADEERSEFTRAHVPLSLGRLALGTGASVEERVVDVLLDAFERRSDAAAPLQQSAAQVLGLLGDADEEPRDVRIRKALSTALRDAKDQQTRRYAAIALAKVGAREGAGEGDAGAEVRETLLRTLTRDRTTLRPWAGLALGVHGAALLERGANVPAEVIVAVRATLDDEKSPELIGALAVAAGLLRDVEAQPALLRILQESREDQARGYAALGLGLLGEASAVEPIRAVLEESRYRPELLSQAAIALGLIGDKQVGLELARTLAEVETLAQQAALAGALGKIGDKNSIDPLIALLEDRDATPLARAFAAVALGVVADKDLLPWNAKLALDLNYRASTETLTGTGDSVSGVLDIR